MHSGKMKKKNRAPRKIELKIDAIGSEGIAIGRTDDGMTVFIKYAAPGDIVEAEIYRWKKNYAEARLLRVIVPSLERTMPRCEHYGVCGGCSWQHLHYPLQCEWKRRHVEDCFFRMAKVSVDIIEPIKEAENIYNYRNKMEFSFGASRWMTDEEIKSGENIECDFALGLHVPGRYDKVLDIKRCHIQSEYGNNILTTIREMSQKIGCECYNAKTHEGFLRNVVLRTGDGEMMVIVVTKSPVHESDNCMISWLANEFHNIYPNIQIIHAINDSLSPVASGLVRVIHGKGFVTETIESIKFRISPFSFFQTNTNQIANFLNSIFEIGNIGNENIIWDLYCGAGTITLPISQKIKGRVVGIEMNESSVLDARANTMNNNIDNVEFYCMDLHRTESLEHLKGLPNPDCVIVDPPRAGVHHRLLEHLLAIMPPKIVYISCNPATQARDCAILAEKYKVRRIRPVDMFPHTFHIESIALLELIES